MSRLEESFAALRARGERALIPFVMAGDRGLATTEALVPALADAGADAIEIGVPFSDPLGEGPTIQRASERALARGTSLRRVLELVKRLRARVDVPLVLMGYANNFLTLPPDALASALMEAGVDGVIVVDLPAFEGREVFAALRARGVDPVLLAAPTTSEARLRTIASETRGFLYYVSRTGVTGARPAMDADLEAGVRRARALGSAPVCVGFGVSTPEHARSIGCFADGVVVGSALVDRMEAAASDEAAVEEVAALVAALKAPLREPLPPM